MADPPHGGVPVPSLRKLSRPQTILRFQPEIPLLAHACPFYNAMDTPAPLPWPDSLCHRCAAPPRYVKTATSTFLLCPVRADKYPRQPVLRCPEFRPREMSTP